MATHIQAGN